MQPSTPGGKGGDSIFEYGEGAEARLCKLDDIPFNSADRYNLFPGQEYNRLVSLTQLTDHMVVLCVRMCVLCVDMGMCVGVFVFVFLCACVWGGVWV